MKAFGLLIIISSLCFSLSAQEGCVVGSRIYINKLDDIWGGFFGLINRPKYENSATNSYPLLVGACPLHDNNIYALQGENQLQRCGFTNNYNSNNIGWVYTYTIIRCPLDDFAWLLFIPLVAVGILKLRKGQCLTHIQPV